MWGKAPRRQWSLTGILMSDGRPAVVFTTNQELGAIPNGTRIEKVNSAVDDAHRDGAQGKVLGSVRPRIGYAYFVEWDDIRPRRP